jgi:Domain of unknown function (DUF927)
MTKDKVLRPWFKLVAVAEDEATKEFFAIIKYRDLDGGVRRVSLPLADLDDKKALVKKLKNLGAYFSGKQPANERALAKLLASKAKAKRHNFAPRVGWCDGYNAFVLPQRVIGAARSGPSIDPPPPQLSCRRHWTSG